MKKFKRKKSEMKNQHHKESFTAHADLAFTPNLKGRNPVTAVKVRASPRHISGSSSPSASSTFDSSSMVDLSGTQGQVILYFL